MTEIRIGVIGLGYVGLPLAVEFSKKFPTFGLDLSQDRVKELNSYYDNTNELSHDELKTSIDINSLTLTNNPSGLDLCNFYVVSVPTPIDSYKVPDLKPLRSACRTIAPLLSKGDIVVFESTVFPGATEEECVPLLSELSGLTYNQDFFCGYSPERINPGDEIHTLTNIIKLTSGSNEDTAKKVDSVYKEIIEAGTYPVSSIKVAEAAKVIENIQRDVNIALVNELAIIFEKLDISSQEVLDAAGTKWNFLKFRPGLVGGHCIGVDPYYLTHKAKGLGLNPELILAGRRINDDMPFYVASKIIKLMSNRGVDIKNSKVLILGFTFKENCPDIRNTKVADLVNELSGYGCTVEINDPLANKKNVFDYYGFKLKEIDSNNLNYDLIVKAVSHDAFLALDLQSYCGLTYDITSTLLNSSKQI